MATGPISGCARPPVEQAASAGGNSAGHHGQMVQALDAPLTNAPQLVLAEPIVLNPSAENDSGVR